MSLNFEFRLVWPILAGSPELERNATWEDLYQDERSTAIFLFQKHLQNASFGRFVDLVCLLG